LIFSFFPCHASAVSCCGSLCLLILPLQNNFTSSLSCTHTLTTFTRYSLLNLVCRQSLLRHIPTYAVAHECPGLPVICSVSERAPKACVSGRKTSHHSPQRCLFVWVFSTVETPHPRHSPLPTITAMGSFRRIFPLRFLPVMTMNHPYPSVSTSTSSRS